MSRPATVFIAGPTASGKSELALHLASMIDAEIVSADAYQVYRGMRLLSAAPDADGGETGIPHHLVGIIDPSESWNASEHCLRATAVIKGIHARGRTALVVGGSGLYLKFLTHGMSEAPPSDEELRRTFAGRSLEDLAGELMRRDPEGAGLTNLDNRRYVERNLEIVILGGKPLSHWRENWNREPNGPGWVLDWDVEALDERIAQRARHMVEAGVIEEVAALKACSPTADRTLGLTEVRSFLAGEVNKEELVARLALVTRQYAKRQRTWLRREKWLSKLPVNSLSSFYALASQVKDLL